MSNFSKSSKFSAILEAFERIKSFGEIFNFFIEFISSLKYGYKVGSPFAVIVKTSTPLNSFKPFFISFKISSTGAISLISDIARFFESSQ